MDMGAVVTKTFNKQVTHVVFKDGHQKTWQKAKKTGVKLVSVLWVESCKESGQRADESLYPAVWDELQCFSFLLLKHRCMQPTDKKVRTPQNDKRMQRKLDRMIKDLNLPKSPIATSFPSVIFDEEGTLVYNPTLVKRADSMAKRLDEMKQKRENLSPTASQMIESGSSQSSHRPSIGNSPSSSFFQNLEEESADLNSSFGDLFGGSLKKNEKELPKETSSSNVRIDKSNDDCLIITPLSLVNLGHRSAHSALPPPETSVIRHAVSSTVPDRRVGADWRRYKSVAHVTAVVSNPIQSEGHWSPPCVTNSSPMSGTTVSLVHHCLGNSWFCFVTSEQKSNRRPAGIKKALISAFYQNFIYVYVLMILWYWKYAVLISEICHVKMYVSSIITQMYQNTVKTCNEKKLKMEQKMKTSSTPSGVKEFPQFVKSIVTFTAGRFAVGLTHSKVTRTLVMTSMPSDKQNVVIQVVNKLGGFSFADTVCESTTHVVTGHPRRTLNVLLGIARGCWILSFEWILWCLERGQWIPEEPYELSDQFPAAPICRLQQHLSAGEHQQDLFARQPVMFVSPLSQPPCGRLAELILLCGGKVCKTVRQAGICIGHHKGKTAPGTHCLSEQWVLGKALPQRATYLNCC
ncbi:MCPH1 protein, partial [Atractosteus spatula]|nr:MCPH1 protein [Atractosteus spatula]